MRDFAYDALDWREWVAIAGLIVALVGWAWLMSTGLAKQVEPPGLAKATVVHKALAPISSSEHVLGRRPNAG